MVKFGSFEVDFESREVRKHGLRMRVEEKPLRILEMLLDRAGRLVSRRTLRESLWPDTHVGFEHSLNTAINKLRELLGDSAQSPRFVETIPRRGYRFIAPVEATPLPEAPSGKRILAILPFENLTPDEDQDYFTDGLTEELISQLGQLSPARLGVIARTSVFAYKHAKRPLAEIARELRADCVLEGSVRRAGRRVRITVQLIDAADETHVWAASYDRELRDVLQMQNDVAIEVGAALAGELLPEKKTPPPAFEPAAHEAYLRGRFLCGQHTEASLKGAITQFEKAISIEPNCARSYAGIAECSALLCWYGAHSPRTGGARATEAAARSLAIAPTLSEAHAAMALVKFWYEWDWAGAEREFERTLELNPSHAMAHLWYASFLNAMGRIEEARAQQRAAQECDPRSAVIHMSAADPHYFSRDFAKAIAYLRPLVESDPPFPPALFNFGRACLHKGMYRNAALAFEKSLEISGNHGCLPALAHAYAKLGRQEEARRILNDLRAMAASRYVAAPMLAWVHLGLGETDAALACLKTGFEERSFWTVFLKMDPIYDPLRHEPRFQGLLREAGFQES
jgi:TolB-like protein/Flp pilus assembly protein TadD